jgi:hypothetical protein
VYSVALKKNSYPAQFEELIVALAHQHQRVVVLIDEYDKPILDYLDDLPQARANRKILKQLGRVKPSNTL